MACRYSSHPGPLSLAGLRTGRFPFHLPLPVGPVVTNDRTSRSTTARPWEASHAPTRISSRLWPTRLPREAEPASRTAGNEDRSAVPILRCSQDRPASAARTATPTASALLTGPSLAGHARPAWTGLCSWRVASCSPLVSGTPHDPQKRFVGGFSWRHSGQGSCSVMFVSSSSRRSTGLYTNADLNVPSSRMRARSALLGPHPGYRGPSP
jgi:hypothetical protein